MAQVATVKPHSRMGWWLFAPLGMASVFVLPLLFIEPVSLGRANASMNSHKTLYRLRTPPGLPTFGLIHAYDGARSHSVTLAIQAG